MFVAAPGVALWDRDAAQEQFGPDLAPQFLRPGQRCCDVLVVRGATDEDWQRPGRPSGLAYRWAMPVAAWTMESNPTTAVRVVRKIEPRHPFGLRALQQERH